jgi:hypothetical protein
VQIWSLSLTLREEHRLSRLRAFENRLLRRVFEPKMNEVMGGWRILHNEQLCSLFSLPSIIRMITTRRMKWAGQEARMGEENVYGYWWESQNERNTRSTKMYVGG